MWRITTHIKYTEEGSKHLNLLILTSLLLLQFLFQILFKTGDGTCSRRKRWALMFLDLCCVWLLCCGRNLCNTSATSDGTRITGKQVDLPQYLQMVSIEMTAFHPMNLDL